VDNINMKELNKINTIKFYTYKNILYILIHLKLLTYIKKSNTIKVLRHLNK